MDEFRSRILKVGIVFIVFAIVAWFFHVQIFDALLAPAPTLKGELNNTSLTGPLLTDIKLSLYVAFLLTIPVLIYQLWMFVAPAVGDMGRAFTYILVSLSSSLFLAGVAFGYFLVLPVGIDFLLSWGTDRYQEIITSELYLPFVTRFLLASGIVFEFPAATFVGAKLGLVDAAILKKYRKHAIVANTILAAALTPGQDPFSMILLAIPMLFMYEVSIVIARYINPVSEVTVRELGDDEDDADTTDDDVSDDDTVSTERDSERDL